MSAPFTAALVGDDGEKPWARGRALAQLVQLAPRFEGRLLHGVLRLVGVAQDRQGGAIARFQVRANQGIEVCADSFRTTHRQLLHNTLVNRDAGGSGLVSELLWEDLQARFSPPAQRGGDLANARLPAKRGGDLDQYAPPRQAGRGFG